MIYNVRHYSLCDLGIIKNHHKNHRQTPSTNTIANTITTTRPVSPAALRYSPITHKQHPCPTPPLISLFATAIITPYNEAVTPINRIDNGTEYQSLAITQNPAPPITHIPLPTHTHSSYCRLRHPPPPLVAAITIISRTILVCRRPHANYNPQHTLSHTASRQLPTAKYHHLHYQTMPSTNRTSVGLWSTSLNATAGLSRRSISAIPCGTTRNIFSSTKVLPASNALCRSSTARIMTTLSSPFKQPV